MRSTTSSGDGDSRRPGGRGARLPAALALVLTAGLIACGNPLPDHVQEDARRRRLQELGVERGAAGGGAPAAGVSAIRRIEVERLDPRKLGADTASAAYHRFLHRCGACHEAPAPSQHTTLEWPRVLTRMHRNVEDAGLLPIAAEDRDVILDFLQRHARER